MVPGKNLSNFVEEQPEGGLNERTARRLLRQMASALRHLHEKGIVHRDLKMQNVMVDTERGLIKIIDFGLSNYWAPREPLTTNCGSPEYAAPELFLTDRKYGPEVDMWSLGVIAFGMAAGCLPFSLGGKEQLSLSDNQQRRLLVYRIQRGLLPKHRNFISHYSKDFANLITGLLSIKPTERFRADDVISHSWVSKHGCRLAVSNNVKPDGRKILLKLSRIVNMLPIDVEKKVSRQSSIAGMHRILYHIELERLWRLLETFSPLHSLSGSLSSGSFITKTRSYVKKPPVSNHFDEVKSRSNQQFSEPDLLNLSEDRNALIGRPNLCPYNRKSRDQEETCLQTHPSSSSETCETESSKSSDSDQKREILNNSPHKKNTFGSKLCEEEKCQG